MAKEKAVMVDVDGTLADMRGVRGPFEWDKVHLDKPHQDVIQLVRDLSLIGRQIIIMTGRDGVAEDATKQWLASHGVPYDNFFIRPQGNFEKDSIIKSRIYMDHIRDNYDVEFILDDRDQVVEMWRSIGLRCLQVAPGDF
jgi:uncharacterized HAD superfamily protein